MRELCDSLLGPLDAPSAAEAEAEAATAPSEAPHSQRAHSQRAAGGWLRWQPAVLGLCKRTLLREVVLPALSTNRALQRILAEYVEQLNAL